MKLSRAIIPTAWLLSVALAFIIGGKINSSSNKASTETSKSNENYTSPSHRSSSQNFSSTRKKSSRNTSSHSSQATRQLDITTIANNEDPIARATDLLKLINSLGPGDFLQVVDDFRALGNTRDHMSEYGMLLHAWAKVAPLAALDYAEENTGTQFARQTILASWANGDPESAIVWARDHHEGEDANPWLVGVIRGIANNDPTRATEVLLELPFSRERGSALEAIIPHIAKQGQENALLWLNTITDDRLHTGATAYLAANLVKSDPAGTAEWVSSLSDSEGKSRAAAEVAQQWVQEDLQSALNWTETLNGASKMNAAREVVGSYANENPSQASAWLQTMSSEPGYEPVVRSYIWNTARNNPELSLSHVPEIQSEKSQRKYYERILRNWKNQDATAAETWMTNHAISDDLRKRVYK